MPAKRLTVQLEEGGSEVVFRVPNRKDLWTVFKSPPLLPMIRRTMAAIEAGDRPMGPKVIEGMVESRIESMDLADALLCRCALRPKLVREPQETYPDGIDCVEEYPVETREDIAGKLLELAGFTEEAAQELLPFWVLRREPPNLPTSETSSDSDPQKSSETSTPSSS